MKDPLQGLQSLVTVLHSWVEYYDTGRANALEQVARTRELLSLAVGDEEFRQGLFAMQERLEAAAGTYEFIVHQLRAIALAAEARIPTDSTAYVNELVEFRLNVCVELIETGIIEFLRERQLAYARYLQAAEGEEWADVPSEVRELLAIGMRACNSQRMVAFQHAIEELSKLVFMFRLVHELY